MKWAPFQLPSTRKPIREFCGLKRNSESLEVAALLYGMLPKLLPRVPPAFLSFQSAVRSMKPTGMMVVSPIFSCSGELAGAAAAVAACGNGEPTAGAGGAEGGPNSGVVEAGRLGFRGVLCSLAATVVPIFSSSLPCASTVASSCSICLRCSSSWVFRRRNSAEESALAALAGAGAGSAAQAAFIMMAAIQDRTTPALLSLYISQSSVPDKI